MKRVQSLLFGALLAACVFGPQACASRAPGNATSYIDDKAISSRVKTELLADSSVGGLGVTVETYRGVVQLRGSVSTAEQKRRATEIAQAVEGVKRVQNQLVVKVQ